MRNALVKALLVLPFITIGGCSTSGLIVPQFIVETPILPPDQNDSAAKFYYVRAAYPQIWPGDKEQDLTERLAALCLANHGTEKYFQLHDPKVEEINNNRFIGSVRSTQIWCGDKPDIPEVKTVFLSAGEQKFHKWHSSHEVETFLVEINGRPASEFPAYSCIHPTVEENGKVLVCWDVQPGEAHDGRSSTRNIVALPPGEYDIKLGRATTYKSPFAADVPFGIEGTSSNRSDLKYGSYFESIDHNDREWFTEVLHVTFSEKDIGRYFIANIYRNDTANPDGRNWTSIIRYDPCSTIGNSDASSVPAATGVVFAGGTPPPPGSSFPCNLWWRKHHEYWKRDVASVPNQAYPAYANLTQQYWDYVNGVFSCIEGDGAMPCSSGINWNQLLTYWSTGQRPDGSGLGVK